MAGQSVFAPKYAHALAEVVASAGLDASAAQAQLKEFSETFAERRELREVFEDPSVPSEQKLSVLDVLAERLGLMREVRNFIAVIMDHQRLGGLNEILAAYDQVAETNKGIVDAEVTSARELNGEDRAELESQVAKLAGSAVRITYGLDGALLGGAVVKIGSTVYDGSVRAQLAQMKRGLMTAF